MSEDVDRSHLEVEDGCGCAEVWEHLSDRRAAEAEARADAETAEEGNDADADATVEPGTADADAESD